MLPKNAIEMGGVAVLAVLILVVFLFFAFPPVPTHAPNLEGRAMNSMRRIMTAEEIARSKEPGYRCSLRELAGIPDPDGFFHTSLLDRYLVNGLGKGYRFAITECTGKPANSYKLVAIPSDPGWLRTFCSDETKVIRYSQVSAEDCLRKGEELGR